MCGGHARQKACGAEDEAEARQAQPSRRHKVSLKLRRAHPATLPSQQRTNVCLFARCLDLYWGPFSWRGSPSSGSIGRIFSEVQMWNMAAGGLSSSAHGSTCTPQAPQPARHPHKCPASHVQSGARQDMRKPFPSETRTDTSRSLSLSVTHAGY